MKNKYYQTMMSEGRTRASQQGDSLPYKPRQAPPSSASPASPVTGRQAGYVNFTSATAREAAMRYVQQQSFGGGVPYQYAARNVVTDRSQPQPSSQVQMQPSVQPPPPQPPHQHPQHQATPQPRQHTPHQATSSPHQHPSHPSTPQPHQHSSHQATPQSHQHPPHQTTPQPHQHPSHPTTPQPHLHPSHPTTPQPHLHPSHQALVQSHQHPPQQTTPQPIQHPSQQAMPQSHQHPSQQTMPQSHLHPSQQAASQSHQHPPHLATSQSHQHPPHLAMPQPHQHPPHQTTPQPHQHPPHQATQQPHQHPPHQATAQLNQHPLHQATPQSHQHLSHQGTPQSHQHPSHQTTPQPHQHPSHQVTPQPLQHMSQTPQPQHPPHQATPQPHQHPPQQTIQSPHQHSPHQATQPPHQHTPSQVTTQPQPSQQPPQSQPQMQFEFIRELPHPPQIRSRISLLPPNSDYMTGLARSRLQQAEMYRENVATSMGASSGSSMQNDVMPPFKKIRLGEMKAEVQKPLRIDTRDQPAYNPEVENISPTIPPDPIVPEDAAFRTTKDELLQQISKVDREILKAETQISNLKKKRQELEKAANKPACIEEEEEVAQPKHQSLAQKIYAVNRKKSQEAHERLDKLGPKVELPLYNQPSDTPVYHENKIRHLAIKTRLIEHLKRRHVERENREKNMTATYSKMMQEWLRKVEKIESSLKRKLKESRNREFFEKVFPELRKQREDRERFNRVGARIKSEADLEEIMDSLQEQEMEDKKMRSYAVIPPILLHPHQREVTYTNNNALIEDFAAEYKERQLLNVWTDAEKDIFKEKYLQHPKNFGVVASYLDRKNVCDSVQHYYLSKKTENYKQLLRKSRQRTRTSRNNPHTKPSTVTTSMTEGLSGPTGVTTRLQREQKAKQEEPRKPVLLYGDEMHEDCNSEKLHSNEVVADVVGFQNFLDSWVVRDITSSATTTTTTVTTTNSTLTVTMTTVALSTIPSSVPSVTITPPSNFAPTSNDSLKPINNNNDVSSSKDPMVVSDQDAVEKTTKNISEEKEKLENKKKERRKEGKRKKEEMETSDDECIDTQEKGGVHPCIVCKTSLDQFLQSRPLPRSHALQYGLSEDQITPGARVCNTCRCKSVRSRYTQCPMPKCPNGKGRVKRLRSLPGKWAELPPEIRNPIIVEFQIPETLTKCCSACFNRISRRLAPHIQDGNAIAEDDQLSQCQQLRWSEEEIESAKRALKEFGTNWSKVAERVGNTKTHHQCKNFYFNYRKKMGLDLLVQEYNKNHLGEERKPTVTDEEESGSSTSSCDEMSGVPLNSDTDSAASPNNSQPIEEKRSSPMKTVLVSDVREEQLDLAKVRQATETEETKAPNPPTQTAVCKEDYDSSATTADEGQGGADADASAVVRQSPKTINYPISSTSVTVVPSQPEGNGPVREGSPPTRSVKDLVLGMIEMQLLKNPGGHGNNTSVNLSGTIVEPTISSILKTDHHAEIHRSDITFGREYRSEAKSRQVQVTQDTSLATLSVVNSHHSSTPTSLHPHLPPPGSSLLERIPQCMQATITQCSTPSSVEFPKEGLVVVQVQQALRENEGVTLDLSIKKPRECSPSPLASIVRDSSPMGSRGDSPYQPIHQHHHLESPSLPPHTTLHTIPPPAHSKTVPSIHHPPSQPSVSVYRTSGVSGETGYYSHPVVLPPEQVHNVSKSQSVFPSETRGSSGPTPHLVMNQLQTQSRVATSTKMLKPAGHSVKVSPKLTHVAAKGGSITHGTPVSTAPLMVPSHLPPFMLQHPPRFEGLLRQMTPPQQTPAHGKDGTPLSGSITQGTPMHHVPHHLSSDKRVERTLIPIPGAVHDYYKRLSPAAPNVGNNHSNVVSGTYPPYPRDGSSTQTTSASGVFTSPYPHQASRPAGYATQQQLSSRQIIMNDYITSQQMDVSRRGSLGLGSNAPLDKTASQQDSPSPRIVSSSPHYYPPSSAASVYCRSSPANSNIMEQSQTPPHHTHTPPTRQGVIQRHNTNPCVQSRPPSSGNTKPPSPAASPHQRLHFLPHHPPTHHPHHHFPPLYPPPPGHEAFSSLVDVAVQQPSLPVPQKDSEKRQSTHHMHHHEGLGKSMADSLSNVRLLAEHQHQERERFSHLPPDQQRFVGFSKDWDVHSEQQRFHQDRFGPSLREGNPEIQQRMAASVREREREREREKDRERERENHLQQQQQRELQHHQQQMHLQKQIQQQQHQQLQLHRQQLQASHQHHNQPQQQQQQQQHQQQQHQQQQQTRITSGYESQKLAMYRENYRDTSDLGVRPQLLDRSFPREIPNAPPRHLPSSQQQLTHGDNRERELSNSGTPRGQGSSSRVAPGGDSSTLTAASLIDAIITHQINQSSTDSSVPGASSGGNSGSLPTRPGDRLFQGVHRDQPAPSSAHQSSGLHIPESNGKTSPLKSSHSPNVVHLDHEQQPTQQESSAPGNNTKVITLAEHIDSIITKDFNINPPTSAVSAHIAPHHRNMAQIYPHHPYHLLPPLPPTSTVAAEIMAEHQSWKLRKALQQQAKEMEVAREREKSSTAPGNALQSDERQIIRVAQPQSPRTKTSSGSYHMEPLSPSEHVASGHHWLPGGSVGSAGPSESMSFLPSRGRYSSEQTKDKPSHLSPLDYVKNRIVEVMRTSEEEKSEQAMTNQKQQPRHHQQHFGGKLGNHPEEKNVFSGDAQDRRLIDDEARHQNKHQDNDHRESGVKVSDKDRQERRCDSPGEMVIDESAGQGNLSDIVGNKLNSMMKGSSPNISIDNVGNRGTGGFPKSSLSVVNPISSTFSIPSITTVSSSVAAAFVPPSTTYAYPFSALNVPSAARSPTPAQVSSVSTKIPVSGANNTNNIQISQQSKTLGSGQSQQSSVPASNSQSDVSSRPVEPAPLLSAQYEPLSDED